MIDGMAIIVGAIAVLTLRPALRSWVAPHPAEKPATDNIGTENVGVESV
jgi:hypothetical protein